MQSGDRRGQTIMNLDKPKNMLTDAERLQVAQNLEQSVRYDAPRRVWVEDGHVFVEGHNGEIVSMLPAVAIKLGRLLSEAGASSLINQVMQESQS
jgi:hypothetical protein